MTAVVPESPDGSGLVQISVRMKPELRLALRRYCLEHGTNMTELIVAWLEQLTEEGTRDAG
jgi:hypothetical protein